MEQEETALRLTVYWWMHDVPDVPFTVTCFGREVSSGTITQQEIADSMPKPRDRMKTPRLDL
jgi:hypothetical protein